MTSPTMSKKVLAACAVAVVAIVFTGVLLSTSTEDSVDDTRSEDGNFVSITVSSSRPGCEEADICYLPPQITISAGESVTWINDDSAFHTVTSGHYDEHDGIFDSGQMDPAQKFSHMFEEPGQFQYYCRLHPWMDGEVIVR
jgi:plastocyanin